MANTNPMYRLVVFEEIDDPRGPRPLLQGDRHSPHRRHAVGDAGTRHLAPAADRGGGALCSMASTSSACRPRRDESTSSPTSPPRRSTPPPACRRDSGSRASRRSDPLGPLGPDRPDQRPSASTPRTSSARQAPAWSAALAVGLRAITFRVGRPPDRSQRAGRVLRDPTGEAIIIRRDPLIAFRIVENQMNYAYLGERLGPKAAENFPVLLADLCAGPITPT